MKHMVPSAYLRVYQPLAAFPPMERARWIADPADGARVDLQASRRWLIESSLSSVDAAYGGAEGAFVRNSGGAVLVCPWRTRLRMLAGLIAFRGSVPEEVAEAFVPAEQARRAAQELEKVEDRYPDVRSYIVHANWHVPLRWFAAFEDSERILTEDADGLRIRYEARLTQARARVAKALEILDGAWVDDSIVGAVRELSDWMEGFAEEGLVELDYGTVARLFVDDELVDDRTAADVWTCLDALSTGDVIRAGEVFAELSEKWAELRSHEAVN